MRCPSCNKFASLEIQDPEVNDLTLDADDLDNAQVTCEVRIVRNSACCNDEMKEYTFNTEVEVPDEIIEKMKEIRKANPDADFEVNEDSVEPVEEGGHRYKKSYYGFLLNASIAYAKPSEPRTKAEDAELEKLNATPYVQQSEVDRKRRFELQGKGRPSNEVLGTVELTDKVEASGMDELN